MDINYLGGNSFKIKGKQTSILINPTANKNEADIVLFNKKGDTANLNKVDNYKKAISYAGEFEVGGVSILGFKTGENITYHISCDGVSVVSIGNLEQELTGNIIDEMDSCDVLLLSFDDKFETVSKLDPYFVIPMGYQTQEEVDAFGKSLGYVMEKMPKLALKKEDITEDLNTKIIELETRR